MYLHVFWAFRATVPFSTWNIWKLHKQWTQIWGSEVFHVSTMLSRSRTACFSCCCDALIIVAVSSKVWHTLSLPFSRPSASTTVAALMLQLKVAVMPCSWARSVPVEASSRENCFMKASRASERTKEHKANKTTLRPSWIISPRVLFFQVLAAFRCGSLLVTAGIHTLIHPGYICCHKNTNKKRKKTCGTIQMLTLLSQSDSVVWAAVTLIWLHSECGADTISTMCLDVCCFIYILFFFVFVSYKMSDNKFVCAVFFLSVCVCVSCHSHTLIKSLLGRTVSQRAWLVTTVCVCVCV